MNASPPKTIFISIASFVDPLLFFTVCRAIHRAKHPERLRFGIVEQGLFDNSWLYKQDPRIRYKYFHPVDSHGVCWARAQVQTLFQDEDLYLQIDSHTAFLQDWDQLLEDEYYKLFAISPKPILSTYPPVFTLSDTGQEELSYTNPDYALAMSPMPDAVITRENPVVMFRGTWVLGRKPVIGFHLAGGFIFTSGRFVQEVPYDEKLYFHGEEQNLALRAFTHGWDVFHPNVLPLFHKYKQAGDDHVAHHWHATWEAQRSMKWVDRQRAANQRLRDLLDGKIPSTDPCGLGPLRTVKGFYDFSGIDYINNTINRGMHGWLNPGS